jgi:hypothetical protein
MFSSLKAKVETKEPTVIEETKPAEAKPTKTAAIATSGAAPPTKSGGMPLHALGLAKHPDDTA